MPQLKTFPMTQKEMDALCPCHLWDDGRYDSLWCRFDAILDKERGVTAAVTWDDDSDFEDYYPGRPLTFFDPQLELQTERQFMAVELTKEDAIRIVMEDPAELTKRYATEIAKL